MGRLAGRAESTRSFLSVFSYRLRVGRAAMAAGVATMAFCTGAAAQEAKGSPGHIRAVTSAIDGNSIRANAATSKDWPAVGLDYGETRFSKLDQINAGNVKNLGLVWSYSLDSSRGVEATPIVVDGIMYVSAPWSVVHAIDARTGKGIWTFDPEVSREKGYRGCCDVVNRGVALHKGKVFVGAYDGRLIALDAATGKKVWEKDTIIDHSHSYTITGAPRVANGRVIIGNGGAEYGVRGYVTAYDAETGNQAWRWFVVPGDPAKPLRRRLHGGRRQDLGSRRQILGERRRRHGVGQHHLRSRAQHRLYRHRQRLAVEPQPAQPGRRRQSLSRLHRRAERRYRQIPLALPGNTRRQLGLHVHPADDPGRPHDRRRAAQGHPACAEERLLLRHRSHQRQVHLGQELRRCELGHRLRRRGRPIEVAEARSPDKPFDSIPGPYGAHNWHPMSFNPDTGLVYLPAQNMPVNLTGQKNWKHNANQPGEFMGSLGWNVGYALNATPPKAPMFGRLIAWDPVKQKEAWRQEHVSPWNGGTLTTAGNLVFQGTADGRFVAYNATSGEKLWDSPTGTGVVAAAATYMVDGKQYVSVAVGWGGVYGVAARATELNNPGTVYTFAVDGKASLPAFTKYQMENLLSGVKYDPADVGPGTLLYVSNCAICHGVPGVDKGGNIRNLAYVGADTITNLKTIVFSGAYKSQGMPDFTGKLKDEDVIKITAFIQGVADSVRPKDPAAAGSK